MQKKDKLSSKIPLNRRLEILIAPNPFKASLSAIKAATAIKNGIKKVLPNANFKLVPVSDGGDGLIETFINAKIAKESLASVHDPLGRKVTAKFAISEDKKIAIIEMASASGIRLLKDNELNPMIASTYGTGELILYCAKKGIKKILLGIGGSATCDCGIGALAALGVKFLDSKNQELKPLALNLQKIKNLDTSAIHPQIKKLNITILCDVKNPLLGKFGTARVFAPQKGATKEQVKELERGLANFAKILSKLSGKNIAKIPGSGAAGGIAASLHAILNAKIANGSDTIFKLLNIEQKIKSSDLVFTGEGKLDSQSIYGKAPAEIAKFAKKHKVPCIAICGKAEGNLKNLKNIGFTQIFELCSNAVSKDDAIKNARYYASQKAKEAIKYFFSMQELKK